MVVIEEDTDADEPAAATTQGKADKAVELLARISATGDFYKILDVDRDADDAAIKKAYRRAALSLHPDKCQLEGSKEAFQKLSSAFGCLSDEGERAYYDRTGRERGAGAVGHSHGVHDPEEMFRQFFGEDFAAAQQGGGGMRFHQMGGQSFVFNMGTPMGGMPGAAESRQAAGAGGGPGIAASLLPWPLGEIVGALPPQLVIILGMWLLFWGFTWLMAHMLYFFPGASCCCSRMPSIASPPYPFNFLPAGG